ncbi:unnamed protein product [Cylindrotheca closterium]|uniref:Acid phosphatase n=1 Tax=Cylindrotheca closterium TaxID=2856 RepID=A0AAD2CII4_9STRA|nr:unnamed protein product [Cylindrotheca closterium]
MVTTKLIMLGFVIHTSPPIAHAAKEYSYRRICTTICHRHGDRTSITALKDEDYWRSTLPKPETLKEIARGTTLIRSDKSTTHSANPKGCWGKLTQLGLLQMIAVGSQLKEELTDASNPLSPKDIRVVSTDFPRTIQSAQAVILGLWPDGIPEGEGVAIDCRHTHWMIPDPQPRNSEEQKQLEQYLISRPYMIQKEEEMRPIAVRCTNALKEHLGQNAFGIKMGIDVPVGDDENILPWAQLAEITCCLHTRDRLPKGITPQDKIAISSHLAWRWFQSLRHPRLANLAMNKFATEIVNDMQPITHNPRLTIYSCHDSSLVGLVCAFNLEAPASWPEYGSVLRVDLLERKAAVRNGSNSEHNELLVRFSLNGELLRSLWDGEPCDEILLEKLCQYLKTVGATKE